MVQRICSTTAWRTVDLAAGLLLTSDFINSLGLIENSRIARGTLPALRMLGITGRSAVGLRPITKRTSRVTLGVLYLESLASKAEAEAEAVGRRLSGARHLNVKCHEMRSAATWSSFLAKMSGLASEYVHHGISGWRDCDRHWREIH
jgi:hypothetical protein